MTTTIDTLEAANLLKKAGFKQDQAEAMIKALAPASYGFITKDHLDDKLESLKQHLKGEIKDLENRLIKWIVVLQITSVATLIGVIVALLNIK